MAGYTLVKLADAPDIFGDSYPGEMRMLKDPLGTEQVAISYRRMPEHTGAKGGYGHRHKLQEEVILVISGRLQVKANDTVLELGPQEAIRIHPGTTQGLWNDRPEDVELLIISNRIDHDDSEKVQDFWPTEDKT